MNKLWINFGNQFIDSRRGLLCTVEVNLMGVSSQVIQRL